MLDLAFTLSVEISGCGRPQIQSTCTVMSYCETVLLYIIGHTHIPMYRCELYGLMNALHAIHAL